MPRMPNQSDMPVFPPEPVRSPFDVWGGDNASDWQSWRKAVQRACVAAGMSRNVARKVAKSV